MWYMACAVLPWRCDIRPICSSIHEPLHRLFQQLDGFFTLAVAIVELAQPINTPVHWGAPSRQPLSLSALFASFCCKYKLTWSLTSSGVVPYSCLSGSTSMHPQGIALQVHTKVSKRYSGCPGCNSKASRPSLHSRYRPIVLCIVP